MFKHFHPHKPFLFKSAKKMIVGTLPPPRFCTKDLKVKDVNFSYGSCDGLLWPSLDRIFTLNLVYENTNKAITQRKDFLYKHNISICDIVESCSREKIDASDLGMQNVVLRDILSYLKEYKNIDTIIFTGGNSKNGPEYFFRKILKEENIKFISMNKEIPKVHSFNYDNRVIQSISLTSPSNAANRFIGSTKIYKENKKINKSYSTFDFRVEQYQKVFKT